VTVFSRDGQHILYIHVPKTGGTAIEEFFSRNGFAMHFISYDVSRDSPNSISRCSPQHMCREQMRAVFTLSRFKYIFMTVRNPYKRLISEFRMQHETTTQPVDFNAWAQKILKQCPTAPYMMDNHIRPQADFHVDRADIFKQEDRYDDRWVAKLVAKTGIKFDDPNVRHQRVAENTHTARINMTDETSALIKNFYAKDFEQFGYPPHYSESPSAGA
jgi:hypothetical protein